jgi:hypothetical protein
MPSSIPLTINTKVIMRLTIAIASIAIITKALFAIISIITPVKKDKQTSAIDKWLS